MLDMTSTVKKLRKRKALTIEQLAEMTGLSKGYLSQIETGTRNPSHDTVALISAALGTSPAVLQMNDDLSLEAIEAFERLSGDQKQEALRYLRFLLDEEDRAAAATSTLIPKH